MLPESPLCNHCTGHPAAAQSFGHCCRLLKAGEEVLWHEEFENLAVYHLFDGKGGVQKINSEQVSTVGFL